MKIAGSEAFEATAFAPENAPGLPPTGAMSPFPGGPAQPPPAPPGFGAPAVQQPFGAPPAGSPYAPPPQPAAGSPYSPPPNDVDAIASTGVAASPGARELRAFLYSFHSDAAGAFWPLFSGNTSIGRAESGEQLDIEINDPTTSSRHCVLSSEAPGRMTLQDTGSTNGTFVNDQPIGYQGTAELRDGDRIRLGGYNASIRFANR